MKLPKYHSLGFSMIELLVVVAIISVLAAIAIPQFKLFLMKSRRAEAQVTLSGIHIAQIGYFSTYDQFYPPNATDLGIQMSDYSVLGVTAVPNISSPSKLGWFCQVMAWGEDGGPNLSVFYNGMCAQNLDTDAYMDQIAISNNFPGRPNCPKGVPFIFTDDLAPIFSYSC